MVVLLEFRGSSKSTIDSTSSLSFLEFTAFLDAFEDETMKFQSQDAHRERYRMKLERTKAIGAVFERLNRLGDHPGEGRLSRGQLEAALDDKEIMKLMISISDAFQTSTVHISVPVFTTKHFERATIPIPQVC